MTAKPKLSLVKPTETEQTLNVLLYGPPKVGKTIGAASAPKPMLYLNADRPNATRMAHTMYDFDEASVEDLSTLMAAMYEIDKGTYKTVVVDPLGETYRHVLEGITGRALRPQIQLYGDTGTHIERFCRALCDKPVNVVFVCHELPTKDEEAGVIERLPFTGTNNPAFAGKLMAMVDAIAYVGIVQKEGEEPRHVGQLVTAGGRRGGDRFGLGPVRDLDLTEWVDYAGQVLKKESGAKPRTDSKTKGAAAA